MAYTTGFKISRPIIKEVAVRDNTQAVIYKIVCSELHGEGILDVALHEFRTKDNFQVLKSRMAFPPSPIPTSSMC